MKLRNARNGTWPAHLFDERWFKIKRILRKTKMSSNRDFVNGKMQCHRSERIPVVLSQETHVAASVLEMLCPF